jgi:hypothetical protein
MFVKNIENWTPNLWKKYLLSQPLLDYYYQIHNKKVYFAYLFLTR